MNLSEALKALEALKSSEVNIIALDGRSGVGKTTIAKKIADYFNGETVVCDDFFIGGRNDYWDKQTARFKIYNVIDWQRIIDEIIIPLKNGQTAKWHPFDWKKFDGLASKTLKAEPKKIIVLDGAFTNRPELRKYIDFSILVHAPKETRVSRIEKREGKKYSDEWHKVWDESIDYYFEKVSPPEKFDLVIE